MTMITFDMQPVAGALATPPLGLVDCLSHPAREHYLFCITHGRRLAVVPSGTTPPCSSNTDS